jgi:hypothetical protein
MSKQSEDIVRQWEEQKEIQKMDKPFMKIFMDISKPKPKPRPKAPKKKK